VKLEDVFVNRSALHNEGNFFRVPLKQGDILQRIPIHEKQIREFSRFDRPQIRFPY
jgi:hypothetical protein